MVEVDDAGRRLDSRGTGCQPVTRRRCRRGQPRLRRAVREGRLGGACAARRPAPVVPQRRRHPLAEYGDDFRGGAGGSRRPVFVDLLGRSGSRVPTCPPASRPNPRRAWRISPAARASPPRDRGGYPWPAWTGSISTLRRSRSPPGNLSGAASRTASGSRARRGRPAAGRYELVAVFEALHECPGRWTCCAPPAPCSRGGSGHGGERSGDALRRPAGEVERFCTGWRPPLPAGRDDRRRRRGNRDRLACAASTVEEYARDAGFSLASRLRRSRTTSGASIVSSPRPAARARNGFLRDRLPSRSGRSRTPRSSRRRARPKRGAARASRRGHALGS